MTIFRIIVSTKGTCGRAFSPLIHVVSFGTLCALIIFSELFTVRISEEDLAGTTISIQVITGIATRTCTVVFVGRLTEWVYSFASLIVRVEIKALIALSAKI